VTIAQVSVIADHLEHSVCLGTKICQVQRVEKISCKGVAAVISLCIFLFALTNPLIVAIYVFVKALQVKTSCFK